MQPTPINQVHRAVLDHDDVVVGAVAYCRSRQARRTEGDPVLQRILRHVEESHLRDLVAQCQPRRGLEIARRAHAIHILSVLREGIRRSGAQGVLGLEAITRERLQVLGQRIDMEVETLERYLERELGVRI